MAVFRIEKTRDYMGAVYPFWKGNNRTGQPRRGKNHPCPAPLRRLYQPQALSGYGRA